MFCLGCGAETSLQATHCPVCGRELGQRASEASRVSSSDSGLGAVMPATARPVSAMAFESVARSEHAPTLPADTTGRVAVATVVAIAVDLLAPWMVVWGTHRSALSLGAPVLVAVPVLGGALLPLLYPSLRRKPTWAAVPLVVGSLCVGAGGAFWAALTYLSYRVSFATVTGIDTGALVPSGAPATAYLPDVGLYLFLLGGAILVYTGYGLFLSTARATNDAAAMKPMPALAVPPDAALVAPAHASLAGDAVPDTTPLVITASRPLSGRDARTAASGQPSAPLPPMVQPAALYGASPVGVATTAPTVPPSQRPHIPLPGSAEWNEAPHQPDFVRPATGWPQGPRPHR